MSACGAPAASTVASTKSVKMDSEGAEGARSAHSGSSGSQDAESGDQVRLSSSLEPGWHGTSDGQNAKALPSGLERSRILSGATLAGFTRFCRLEITSTGDHSPKGARR